MGEVIAGVYFYLFSVCARYSRAPVFQLSVYHCLWAVPDLRLLPVF
jgi:hypothetical protein